MEALAFVRSDAPVESGQDPRHKLASLEPYGMRLARRKLPSFTRSGGLTPRTVEGERLLHVCYSEEGIVDPQYFHCLFLLQLPPRPVGPSVEVIVE